VAKVSELKERARILEQQGDLAKARAIYEHILKHLEGTPALLPELPMYVKVGDLSLKLGDPPGAVSMYEKAAGHYAAAGSARSIGALAEKIRRADPTRDDAAVGLGRALLEHGHAGAAAEVLVRYARRVERDDVVGVLADIAPTADGAAAAGIVERAVSMLAGPPPAAPEPAAEERSPEPVTTAAPAPAPDEPEEPGEEDAEARLDLPLISFEPEAPAEEPPPPVSEADDGLVIRHGVEEPTLAAAPAPAPPVTPVAPAPTPPKEWDFTAPVRREPEPAAAPEAAAPAEPIEEPVVQAEPEPPSEAPPLRVPEEPEHVPATRAAEPRRDAVEAERPSRGRGWPEEPHVLVRQPRAQKSGRGGLIAAGIALVVVVGGAAAAWALGLLPFGRGGDGGRVSEPAEETVLVESLPAPGESAAAVGDTAQFGPIGFNTVTNAPVEPPAGDTALGDTAGTALGGADTLAPTAPPEDLPAPARAAVVVPPGHAIVNEIVVIPGLEVLSVSETRVAGALGVRVIQRAEDGEIALVATVGNFGPDTAGSGVVTVRTEGDTAIGEVRVGRYLVEGRSALPADLLSGLLGRLIRARPVN
jgi:hypothetical protein